MSNQPHPDHQPTGPAPDPAAPPPGPSNAGPGHHPAPTHSGEPSPPTFMPGHAPLPRPPQPEPRPEPDYPPTSQFPPVNYAPPGYAPDYGQQGYAQPGYDQPGFTPPPYGTPGYPAPPPPRRRGNGPLIAVIAVVSLVLCGGAVTAGILVTRNVYDKAKAVGAPYIDPTDLPTMPTDLPTDLPTDAPTDDGGQDQGGQDNSGDTITVTYEVTGDGPASILYLEKLGSSPTRVASATLPWKFTVTVSKPAVLSVVAMRTDTSEGHVTCHTLVDGQEVKENTSGDGAYATAACSYVAFD